MPYNVLQDVSNKLPKNVSNGWYGLQLSLVVIDNCANAASSFNHEVGYLDKALEIMATFFEHCGPETPLFRCGTV